MGRGTRAKVDCVGQVGYNVSPKGKRGIRNSGHQEIQSSSDWKMEMKSISSPRGTLGQDIGFKIWWLEVHG